MPTSERSVLSGGQRKRLSVAVELLKRPRILLLDEPTSGLDTASEANLMEQLRYVASRGTTVICTTHLMENVRLLDNLIVLGVLDGVGRIAYVGPPGELFGHFGCRSFADLYEELSAGRFVPLATGAEEHVATGDSRAKVDSRDPVSMASPGTETLGSSVSRLQPCGTSSLVRPSPAAPRNRQ